MIAWCRTPDGWAVNLDGTDASRQFSLPRIELHSGPHGWTCLCHRPNGTTVHLRLEGVGSLAAAKRAAAEEAVAALGAQYEAPLRALLEAPSA